VSGDLERLRRNHRPAFLAWLSRRDEAGLRSAYELGRDAMQHSVGVLDLVRVHNEALLDVMSTARSAEEAREVARLAADYLVELLAPFEMARRGFMDLGPGRGPGDPAAPGSSS